MKNYVLENDLENARLEKQSQLKQYSLETELRSFALQGHETILDAGCGNGLLGRHLKKKHPHLNYWGCDLSPARIKDAQAQSGSGFNFKVVDLFNRSHFEAFPEKFDKVINRFVMHHLKDHKQVLENFFNVLKPNGSLCLVDADGVFVNVGTTNAQLRAEIDKIAANFGGDLQAARLMPNLMAQVGFKNIRWEIQTMDFQGQDRQDEVEQFSERLEFGKETYAKILGGELAFRRFAKAYLAELASPTTAVFYNKFIIQAEK